MKDSPKTEPAGLAMDRGDWLWLGAALFVLFATRILWVVWNPEATLYWEEDYRWVAARELLSGPHQPIFEYQADNYQGGSLVLIGLVTVLFALFGESLLVLKLAPLLFSALILASMIGVTRVWFGRRAARIAACGYLAGPPLLLYSGLIPMGSHGESTLFSLLQIGCFLGIQSGRWNTLSAWAALGFISGLGLWFCYTSGLSIAACAITWWILEGLPKLRPVLVAGAAAVVGLVPWFIYNLQTEFSGFSRLLEIFGSRDSIDAWIAQRPLDKFVDLVVRDLPTGMIDPFLDLSTSGIAGLGVTLEWIFYLGWGIALAIGIVRVGGAVRVRMRNREAAPTTTGGEPYGLVFYVYFGVFVAVYLNSSFDLEQGRGAHAYRLLLPLVTLMWIPVADAFARSIDGRSWRSKAAAGGLAAMWLACVSASVMLALRTPGEETPGRDVMEHVYRGNLVRGVLLHRKYERNLVAAYDRARRVPDLKERFRVFQGIGWGIEYRYEGSGELTPFLTDADGLGFGEQVAVLAGVIWTTGNRVAELEEIHERGTATTRDGDQLNRLKKLKTILHKQWRRLPESYQQSDRVIY